MTGVIEVGLAAAAMTGLAGLVNGREKNQSRLEENEAERLYLRFFGESLREVASAEVTVRAGDKSRKVDPTAEKCVGIIEDYQSRRRTKMFKWVSDFSGDIRTLVLEELKDWLLTVSWDTQIKPDVVGTRLEYCRQLLLRPSVFKADNDFSFLQSIAKVCQLLDTLHRRLLTETKMSADRLKKAFEVGKELLEKSMSIFLYALSNDVTQRAKSWDSPPKEIDPCLLLAAANKVDDIELNEVDFSTTAGEALRETIRTSYFNALYLENVQREDAQAAYAQSFTKPGDDKLRTLLDKFRTAWQSSDLGEDCGLLEAFRAPSQKDTRMAYIDLLGQVDRLAYFLHKMHPFKELGLQGGDIAMCRLHRQMMHLLQELESDLVIFRQAWLEVMRGTKRHLLVVTKRSPNREETYWLQGLRYIDAVKAGDLYKEFMELCNEIKIASSESRASELEQHAIQGIENMRDTFGSAHYQALLSTHGRQTIQDVQSMTGRHMQTLTGGEAAEALAIRN